MKPSKTIVGARLPAPDKTVFVAYGEPDDHLRLLVELALRLRDVEGAYEGYQAELCLRKEMSWEQRSQALRELLVHAQPSEGIGTLLDPDALSPASFRHSTRTPWDSERFVRERHAFYDLLRTSFEDGGWTLIRVSPHRGSGLPDSHSSEPDEPPIARERWRALAGERRGGAIAEAAERLSPALHQGLHWLLEERVINAVQALDVLHLEDETGAHRPSPREEPGAARARGRDGRCT